MEDAVNRAEAEETWTGLHPSPVTWHAAFQVRAEDILSQVAFSSAPIEEIVLYFLKAPAKRLRPVLVHMSAALVGRPARRLDEAAALVEILHNGTLIHDDVIDNARMRRGQPSVNRLWGDSAGILVGDYLLAHVMELAHRIAVPRILHLSGSILLSLVEGQWLELGHQDDCGLSRETYFEIIRKKTAALIQGACEMGGILACGEPMQTEALRRFGENLGMAFQIIDDCLDYCGNAAFLGKEIGKDFLEGKITLPVILAGERASFEDRRKIREAFQLKKRRGSFLAVQAVIDRNQGLRRARQEARSRTQRAVDALAVFPAGPVRETMENLARGLLDRIS